MTPSARAAAAIEVLDAMGAGRGAEAVLKHWARGNRYAGSSDRSAIRDMVYDILRQRRSCAAWGGGDDGRSLVLGALRVAGMDPALTFGAGPYAPPPLTEGEAVERSGPWPEAVVLDVPDFLLPRLKRSLGGRAGMILPLMKRRAEVHIRANLSRGDAVGLARRLGDEGIEAEPHPLSPAALVVGKGARRLRNTEAFKAGLFELQDASSQMVADAIPVSPDARVLDYCAGAGGKTLAMAGRVRARWFAHDAEPARLRDLPERAARAGCDVTVLPPGGASAQGPYDVVLVDAPCSGTGAWRRDPEAKWTLTPERLEELRGVQAGILDEVAPLVREGGVLAYATCSLLQEENGWQVDAFCRRYPGWRVMCKLTLTPLEGGDGFYLALLKR